MRFLCLTTFEGLVFIFWHLCAGGTYRGRNRAVTPSSLEVLWVLHGAFATWLGNGPFTLWISLVQCPPPLQKKVGVWSSFLQIPPIRTAFEVCWPLPPSTDARILQSQEPCISGDISIYLKTLFCSNPCPLHLNFRLVDAKYLVFHKSCKDGNLVGELGFSPCFKFTSLKGSATR